LDKLTSPLFFVRLIIPCNVGEQKEVRDAKAMRSMTLLKHDKGKRARAHYTTGSSERQTPQPFVVSELVDGREEAVGSGDTSGLSTTYDWSF
jgi:hypothetical protein